MDREGGGWSRRASDKGVEAAEDGVEGRQARENAKIDGFEGRQAR